MKIQAVALPLLLSITLTGCNTLINNSVNEADVKTIVIPTTLPTIDDINKLPVAPPKKPVVKVDETPTVKLGKKTAQGKLILGNKEWVYIDGVGITVEARVDTGATTSSASASNIMVFERDGKEWVRFNLSHNGADSKEIELPVHSVKRIRQSNNSDETEKRYTVMGWIQVGDLKVKTPFTLVDRSHMEYALLLGRSFFLDEAIVDVSREFIQGKVDR